MLFNSYVYLFAFLPLTYIAYRLLLARNLGTRAASLLVIASLIYYAWWNPAYLVLILGSMLANFEIGRWIQHYHQPSFALRRKRLLIAGIAANLIALGYYKYAGFLGDSLNFVINTRLSIPDVVLPLAISFFTFQQIAYLVDVYRGEAREYRAIHYALFVTFFPQLIAGPIVHHREMLPQFSDLSKQDHLANFVVGSTIFFIGLFKKAVLADGVAKYANPAFDAALNGGDLSLLTAWGGVLSYTLQLYFDFSGYSDMAIGSARLFGIKLPLNFHSPYKALSISEFWRRWHMTLSRFLRDYLYITLGGNRRGPIRRYANLFITMLLGGLWHGAGWNFVIWGGLHGTYLMVNHAWAGFAFEERLRHALARSIYRAIAWGLTFGAVVLGWVFFRAQDFHSAMVLLEAMIGMNGVALPNGIMVRLGPLAELLQAAGVGTFIGGGTNFVGMTIWVGVLLVIAIFCPNTQEIMARFEPALVVHRPSDSHALRPVRLIGRFRFQLNGGWAVFMAGATVIAILALNRVSEFLYYQF